MLNVSTENCDWNGNTPDSVPVQENHPKAQLLSKDYWGRGNGSLTFVLKLIIHMSSHFRAVKQISGFLESFFYKARKEGLWDPWHVNRVFWFIILNSLQWKLGIGLSGILHCRGFAAMISLPPWVCSLTSEVMYVVYQAALSNCLLAWWSSKVLVNFNKSVLRLVCSLWKCVLSCLYVSLQLPNNALVHRWM